jgi:hypothetical protein
MHGTTAPRSVRRPLLILLLLYALAHNWAGITDAYFSLAQWLGAQAGEWFRHALEAGAPPSTK